MKINVTHNIPEVAAALRKAADQVPFALSVSLNAVAEKARMNVRSEMSSVFDRPTPWVLNSLRVKRATKQLPEAELAFKDKNSAESSRSMIEPHVFAGSRRSKPMEGRLRAMGMLPQGYIAVPGEAAQMDGYGNMSKGQINQLLNVLGTYQEDGYNKANSATRSRLAKGNVKRNTYGFAYFVSYAGAGRAELTIKNGEAVMTKGRKSHLAPGVYKRFSTGFGSSLKPILMFVKQANYKKRLDLFGVVQKTVDKEFALEFDKAFGAALATAKVRS
jgi:hypothetical protein